MIEYLLVLLGVFLLINGANFLVNGSSSLARKLNVSDLFIGLTVVAFGTSAPEFIISIISSFRGTSEVVLGNIVGANITDILWVLGITFLLTNVEINKKIIWNRFPLSLIVALLLIVMANDSFIGIQENSYISRVDGFIMLILFTAFMVYSISYSKRKKIKTKVSIKDRALTHSILFIILGSGLLFFGGKLVLDNLSLIAQQMGISLFIISSTLLSIGTTLPEFITAIVAVKKKENDIAVGEIVGSTVFNILVIIGLAAIIHPINVDPIYNLHMIFLAFVSLILFISMMTGTKHKVEKIWGVIFLIFYILYLLISFSVI